MLQQLISSKCKPMNRPRVERLEVVVACISTAHLLVVTHWQYTKLGKIICARVHCVHKSNPPTRAASNLKRAIGPACFC